MECLTCHARSAHHFVPVDSTCSQKGCHLTDDISIKLGKMAGQTGLHCIVCHKYTRVVPGLATFDSAKGSLVPGVEAVFLLSRHAGRLADFNPERDPHSGTCGMCHNPHENVKPKDALKSCADAGCHADWRKVDFHQGAAHRKLADPVRDLSHTPRGAGGRLRLRWLSPELEGPRRAAGKNPPLPFDTLKALQRTSGPLEIAPPSPHGKGDAPIDDPPPGPPSQRRSTAPALLAHKPQETRLHQVPRSEVADEPPQFPGTPRLPALSS